jgi:hypothetical protein
LIKEHNKTPSKIFPSTSITGATLVGPMQIKRGPIEVYQKDLSSNVIELIAYDKNDSHPILGYVVFVMIQNNSKLWMAKQAQSNVRHENLLYNLILFIKKKMAIDVISDIDMTDNGERAWQKMAQNPSLGVKLYNIRQNKKYDLNDPSATKPELDTGQNGHPIEWFYIIEQYFDPYIGEAQYCMGICPHYYEDINIPDQF